VLPELLSRELRWLPVVRILRSHVREVHVLAAEVAAKQTQAHLAFGSESSGRWASWSLRGKGRFRGQRHRCDRESDGEKSCGRQTE